MKKCKWKWWSSGFFILVSLVIHFIESLHIIHISIESSKYMILPQLISEPMVFGLMGFTIGWLIELFFKNKELEERINASDKIKIGYYE